MRFTNLTRHVEIGANCYAIEIAGRTVVLDAGMHPRLAGNAATPAVESLPPGVADGIFLSHAHQDHLGSLPVLCRRNPNVPVFMTKATYQLADVMLHNSVNVMTRQREELGTPDLPLFTHREVDQLSRTWRSMPLRTPFDLTGERLGGGQADVSFELFDAGHILGSSGILIRGEGRSIFYTGDVNFEDQTLSRAADFPTENVDVLIMETTRGDSPATPGYTRTNEALRLANAIGDTFERGGCVLIPVFALGKTQELLAMLHGLNQRGELLPAPIYIGGLSTKLTEMHDKLAHQSPRLLPDLQILDHVAPFVITGSEADTVPIRPRRIYALSSGMMTEKTPSNTFAQRIMSNPENSIFFVGYCDPNSPAGKLRATPHGESLVLEKNRKPQPLRCKVDSFQFSGHGSRESLRAYAKALAPRTIILVHGDPAAIEWFRETLSADLPGTKVLVPEPGVPLDL